MSTNPSATPSLALSGGTITGNLNVTGHYSGTGSAPGAAAGGNAGTGPPAPAVATGSTDQGGTITFGTGTVPSAGVEVVVTFVTPWVIPGGGPPHIVLIPNNLAAQALGLFVSGISPTGFNVSCANAPAASQANGTYGFCYVVMG